MTDRAAEATQLAMVFAQAVNHLGAIAVPSALERLRAAMGDAVVRAELRTSLSDLLKVLNGWQERAVTVSAGGPDIFAAQPALQDLLETLSAEEANLLEVSRRCRQALERMGLVPAERWAELDAKVHLHRAAGCRTDPGLREPP